MSMSRVASAGLLLAALLSLAAAPEARANGRQYYSGWTYYPQRTYYYRTYYYKPYASYDGYQYHYCIYSNSTPNYVYYYNPVSQTYWGRFDVNGKPGAQYSILKDEDRKSSLKDIPESAFPTPGAMPAIPESKDGSTIEPPQGLPDANTPVAK